MPSPTVGALFCALLTAQAFANPVAPACGPGTPALFAKLPVESVDLRKFPEALAWDGRTVKARVADPSFPARTIEVEGTLYVGGLPGGPGRFSITDRKGRVLPLLDSTVKGKAANLPNAPWEKVRLAREHQGRWVRMDLPNEKGVVETLEGKVRWNDDGSATLADTRGFVHAIPAPENYPASLLRDEPAIDFLNPHSEYAHTDRAKPVGKKGEAVNRSEQIYPASLPRFLQGKKVLDIGAGEGGFVKSLRGQGVDAQGIDAQLSDAGVTPFMQKGDARKLPYPDASFDVALSSYSVFLYEQNPHALAAYLKEAARVVKPGGYFFFGPIGAPHTFAGAVAEIPGLKQVTPKAPEMKRFTEKGLVILRRTE